MRSGCKLDIFDVVQAGDTKAIEDKGGDRGKRQEATESTKVKEATKSTKVKQATKSTKVKEAMQATKTQEATEATEAAEATEATEAARERRAVPMRLSSPPKRGSVLAHLRRGLLLTTELLQRHVMSTWAKQRSR